MGILLLAATSWVWFRLFHHRYKSVAMGIMATFVAVQAYTVLIAEITSLWTAFSLYPLLLCWGGLLVVLCIQMHRKNCVRTDIGNVQKQWRLLSFPAKAFLLAAIFTALLVVLRALLYPPQNVDSLMYHLSRAALYYKNSTIHNFPAQYAWALYTGPLSAILMAQQMIFLHGNDFLCNLVQFPGWIAAAVAVYILARRIGVSRNWAFLSAWLALTCPQAVLQGATTQTDLLAAACCVVAVALLNEGVIREKDKTVWILAGLAGGQAVLAKISSAIVLLPFLIWFLIRLLKTHRSLPQKVFSLIVLACTSVSMVTGFWLRNAMDLSGDFLALKLSASMSGIQQPVMNNLLGRAVVNLACCMGGANRLWCEAIDRVSRGAYSLLGANEINLEDITCYQTYISHDEQPYPLVMILLTAGILIGAIVCAAKRTRNWSVLGYSLAAAFSGMLLAISIGPGIASICRYILGPVFLAVPLIGFSAQKVSEYAVRLTKCRAIPTLIAGGILWSSLFMVVFVSLFDARQPLAWKWYSYSRDELRNIPYASQNWAEPTREFMKIIQDQEITKIAVTEQVVGGYYPFLYALRSSKYEVKTIDMKFGSTHEDQNFEPQAIMQLCNGSDVPNTYEKNGKVFRKISEVHPLLFNNACAVLYVDEAHYFS